MSYVLNTFLYMYMTVSFASNFVYDERSDIFHSVIRRAAKGNASPFPAVDLYLSLTPSDRPRPIIVSHTF